MIKTHRKTSLIILVLFVVFGFIGCSDDEEEDYCGDIVVPGEAEYIGIIANGNHREMVFLHKGKYISWESWDSGECWERKFDE